MSGGTCSRSFLSGLHWRDERYLDTHASAGRKSSSSASAGQDTTWVASWCIFKLIRMTCDPHIVIDLYLIILVCISLYHILLSSIIYLDLFSRSPRQDFRCYTLPRSFLSVCSSQAQILFLTWAPRSEVWESRLFFHRRHHELGVFPVHFAERDTRVSRR